MYSRHKLSFYFLIISLLRALVLSIAIMDATYLLLHKSAPTHL